MYGSMQESSGSEGSDSSPLVTKHDVEEYNNGNGVDEKDDDGYNYCATYFRSWRFVEFLLCCVPVAIWLYFENADITPTRRPIPYSEVLDYNGEPLSDKPHMVWSAVHSLKYNGSTVGHKTSEFLNGFCPLVLQLALIWYHAPSFASVSDRLDGLHRTVCMYFVALGTTDTICNFTKFSVSLHSPSFEAGEFFRIFPIIS